MRGDKTGHKQGVQMELVHLKATGCPTCGARVIEETQKDRQYSNWWGR